MLPDDTNVLWIPVAPDPPQFVQDTVNVPDPGVTVYEPALNAPDTGQVPVPGVTVYEPKLKFPATFHVPVPGVTVYDPSWPTSHVPLCSTLGVPTSTEPTTVHV